MRKAVLLLALVGLLAACTISRTHSPDQPLRSGQSKPELSNMSKKETAVAFVQAVTHQDAEKIRALANTDYIQHNPFLPTGLEPFIGLFPVLRENQTNAQQIRVIEEGSYVVIHHLWTGAKPLGADEMVSFDILRFHENVEDCRALGCHDAEYSGQCFWQNPDRWSDRD